jgi:hypothetical protein
MRTKHIYNKNAREKALLEEAYIYMLSEDQEGGPINGNEIELTNDPSAQQVQKKAIPLQYRIAEKPEIVQTLENPVKARVGDYIMTGTRGENWPIPVEKMKETYDIIDDSTAAKKPLPVPAKQMQEDFFVTVSWSTDKLQGKPGDWLVQYGPGDYGVVEASIFDETYDLLGEDEEHDDEWQRAENERERARVRAREAEDKGDWDEWNRQENKREEARDRGRHY